MSKWRSSNAFTASLVRGYRLLRYSRPGGCHCPAARKESDERKSAIVLPEEMGTDDPAPLLATPSNAVKGVTPMTRISWRRPRESRRFLRYSSSSLGDTYSNVSRL